MLAHMGRGLLVLELIEVLGLQHRKMKKRRFCREEIILLAEYPLLMFRGSELDLFYLDGVEPFLSLFCFKAYVIAFFNRVD